MHHLDLVHDFRHLVLGDALDGDVRDRFFLSSLEDLGVLPCPNFVEDGTCPYCFLWCSAVGLGLPRRARLLRGLPRRPLPDVLRSAARPVRTQRAAFCGVRRRRGLKIVMLVCLGKLAPVIILLLRGLYSWA